MLVGVCHIECAALPTYPSLAVPYDMVEVAYERQQTEDTPLSLAEVLGMQTAAALVKFVSSYLDMLFVVLCIALVEWIPMLQDVLQTHHRPGQLCA